MEISVIIPVYNASRYVTQAVESALAQPETAEVLLMEDGSPDNALEICQGLAEKHDKVRLLRHPHGENRGAAASRNLGMLNAKYDYIAFLDADDYFLPNRFIQTAMVFEQNPDCGGVYEAIGTVVEDDEAKERWRASGEMQQEIITMTRVVPPGELLERLALGGAGYFHLDGLVFRKELLNVTGFMDEELRLHQDNEFFFRLAAATSLFPGSIAKSIAMRRVHWNNRITSPEVKAKLYESRLKMWISSFRWFNRNRSHQQSRIICKGLLKHYLKSDIYSQYKSTPYKIEIIKRINLIKLLFRIPQIVTFKEFWKSLLPKRFRS